MIVRVRPRGGKESLSRDTASDMERSLERKGSFTRAPGVRVFVNSAADSFVGYRRDAKTRSDRRSDRSRPRASADNPSRVRLASSVGRHRERATDAIACTGLRFGSGEGAECWRLRASIRQCRLVANGGASEAGIVSVTLADVRSLIGSVRCAPSRSFPSASSRLSRKPMTMILSSYLRRRSVSSFEPTRPHSSPHCPSADRHESPCSQRSRRVFCIDAV